MDTWRGMWIHVCGVGGKRPCAISTDILEFRLIGVHARIGTVRSSRSTLISYSRQPSLQGCIANHWEINDLNPTLRLTRPRFPMHVYEVRSRKDHRGVNLVSDALPFGRLWYGEPNAISNAIRLVFLIETQPTDHGAP